MDQFPFSDHVLIAQMNLRDSEDLRADINRVIAATRKTIDETLTLFAEADKLLARR